MVPECAEKEPLHRETEPISPLTQQYDFNRRELHLIAWGTSALAEQLLHYTHVNSISSKYKSQSRQAP
jgi:hypothetical protein